MFTNASPTTVDDLCSTLGVDNVAVHLVREELNIFRSHWFPTNALLWFMHHIVMHDARHMIFSVDSYLV